MQNHLQVKCNHYQNSMEFFSEKEKKNPNICICKEPQKTLSSQNRSEKKWNKARGNKHYKAIVMFNSMILVLKQLLRSLKQICPEISPHIHVQVAFDKEIKEHSMRIISFTNGIENKS